METLLIVVMVFIVLDIASLRWGFDSTEKLDSPEWERRATWSAHLAGPDPDNGERTQMLTWSQSPHH
jgi:hypothetical protein